MKKNTIAVAPKRVLAVGMTVLFAVMIIALAGICFETNDDRATVEFLSGSLTGSPDARAIHLNYMLSYPLMRLYSVLPDVPWYGLFLIAVHCVALYLIIKNILDILRTKEGIVWGVLLSASLLLADIYMLSRIQYTSTAALLAIAGYSCVLFPGRNHKKKNLLLFFGMEFLALLLRLDAMLMMQLMGMAALIGAFLGSGKYRDKHEWKQLGSCVGIVAVALLLGQAGNAIGYSSEEWKEYYRLDDARIELFDYYGFPEYEEVRDILDKYGVTETEYAAYRIYATLEYELSVECVEELAAYVQASRAGSGIHVGALLRESWAVIFSSDRQESNNLVGILWVGAILTCAFVRKKEVILPFLSVAAARTVVWGYLIYRGRLPARVTKPLLVGEAVMLLVFLLYIWEGQSSRRIFQVLAGAICACFALWACASGYGQLRYVREANATQKVMMESFQEVREYCEDHPENRYILDCNSFSSFIGSALGNTMSGTVNYVYSGGWYSNSPNVLRRIDEYLGKLEDPSSSVYLIIYDWSGDTDMEGCGATVQYLEEKTARQPILVETLTLANGGLYLVIKF